jgi:polyphenol oxidase
LTDTHDHLTHEGSRLPETGAGFFWDTERHGVGTYPVLRPRSEHAVAVYTTRLGGVSLDEFAELNVSASVGDGLYRVMANRDLAARAIGRGPMWSHIKQVHGATVVPAHPRERHHEADAQWTDDAEMTLAVTSADCVLLLLAGPMRVGVVHAGWRGMVAGVIENAIEVVEPTEVFAGPAIGPCCFEVGPEVIDAFADRDPKAVLDARHVDLWVAAEQACRRAGVDAFSAARLCTSCLPELFYSHRRDKGYTGRQALIARLTP